jgi:hypothetical protein
MKRAQILLIFFLLFGFDQIFAQENPVSTEKWLRIESDAEDFSVALPSNAIIDAEERKYGQILKAVAFQNGVEMELLIIKSNDDKYRRVNILPNDGRKLVSFKVGEFMIIKSEPRLPTGKFHNSFFIVKKDTTYTLSVTAKTGREKEVEQFLDSLILDGKSFAAQKEKQNLAEELVSVSALKTSAEVTEAFNRKLQKNKIKVTYEAASSDADDVETEGLTRPATILERPSPTLDASFASMGGASGIFAVKLKINFLANGSIGDITVLSVVNKEFSKACVEAAQKIRFVPAQSNGKNVDSVRIVEYTIGIFSAPVIVPR